MFLPHIKVNQSAEVVAVVTSAEPVAIAPAPVASPPAIEPEPAEPLPVPPAVFLADYPEPLDGTFYTPDGCQSFKYSGKPYGAERVGNCQACHVARKGPYWIESTSKRFDDPETGKNWLHMGMRFLCMRCAVLSQQGLNATEPERLETVPPAGFSEETTEPAEVVDAMAQGEPGTAVPAELIHNVDSDDSFDDFESRESAVIAFGKTLEATRTATIQGTTFSIRGVDGVFVIDVTTDNGTQTITRGTYGFQLDSFDRTAAYAVQKARSAFVCEPETMPNGCQMERRFHKRRECWVFVVTLPEPLSGSRFNTQETRAKRLGGWYGREYKPEFQRGGFMFLERRAADRFANDFTPSSKVATMRRSGAAEPVAEPVTPSEDFSESSDSKRSFSINRLNRQTNEMEPHTFAVGESVQVFLRHTVNGPEFEHGQIRSVRHADDCVTLFYRRDDGTRYASGPVQFGRIYKADYAKTQSIPSEDFSDVPTFGDRVQTPDGVSGIMQGSGGIGSDRVGVADESGKLRAWANRSELTKAPAVPRATLDRVASIQRETVSAKLDSLAAGMQATIDEKLRPMSQNWTHKRAGEYAHRVHEGENLQRCQEALRTLADHWRAGTVPEILQSIRTKSAVLPLVSEYRQGREFTPRHGADIFHKNTMEAVTLRDLVAQSKSPDAVAQAQALAKRKAIEAAENKLRTANVPGFFPTPPALCQQMIQAADLPDTPSEDFSILEPSAGIGSIIDAILETVPAMADHIEAFEIAYSPSEVLNAKGYQHVRGDFLQHCQTGEYDRILMNPPFENNADIDHVQHAYKWLKPGGRLVAIISEGSFNASASRQKVAAFQYWLNDIGAESTPIRDAFKDATAFRNTGVAVRLVVIDKPE